VDNSQLRLRSAVYCTSTEGFSADALLQSSIGPLSVLSSCTSLRFSFPSYFNVRQLRCLCKTLIAPRFTALITLLYTTVQLARIPFSILLFWSFPGRLSGNSKCLSGISLLLQAFFYSVYCKLCRLLTLIDRFAKLVCF